jgi:hypothetical protein
MTNSFHLEFIFIAIGVIFSAIALRDYIKAGRKVTIACKIRLRIAIIFVTVGIVLYIFNH